MAALRRARRRLARAAAAAALACPLAACRAAAPAAPTGVLLVSVDTLRADQLGAYAPGARTPRLDRLAAEGTLYERAVAPMPLTRPSHASMLTALYPREHGVVNNRIALPGDVRSLASLLREAGLRTAAFVGVKLLGPDSGLASGFETYGFPDEPRERAGSEVVAQALGWLAGLAPNERFFLWVHLFDPHLPYAPPAELRDEAAEPLARSLPEISWPVLEAVAHQHGGDVPREVLDHARALYRAEVASVDRDVGALLDGLAARRDLDEVLVIVIADHGECFERGSYFDHADCLSEGATRIPLLVRWPPGFARGARVATPASAVDVAPSVLRALGLDVPEGLSGVPLQELSAPRFVMVQHPFYQPEAAQERSRLRREIRSVAGDPIAPLLVDAERVGIVGSDFEYFVTGGRAELHALASPAAERENLAASRPELRARLDAILADELARHPMRIVDPGRIHPELLETLRALGYAEE